jgi:hypothetical protein
LPSRLKAVKGRIVVGCTVVLFQTFDGQNLLAQQVLIETAVNLRPSPSKAETRITVLGAGDTVELVGPDSLVNGFFRVRTKNNEQGWVAISFAHRIRTPLLSSADTATRLFAQPLTARSAARCTGCGGTDRWNVKTLSDDDAEDVVARPYEVTIRELRSYDAPEKRPQNERAGEVELTTYRVEALLIGWLEEPDADFHLVIADPSSSRLTMIAEIPTRTCKRVCTTAALRRVGQLQQRLVDYFDEPTGRYEVFRQPIPITITGVGFFDKKHKGCGRSKHNAIELHPVVDIDFDDSVPLTEPIYRSSHPPCD